MGRQWEVAFYLHKSNSKPHRAQWGGSQRVGGTALPKNWDKSPSQEDPGANMILF